MSEGGYPVVGPGGTSESPLPAGYGSLDAGFPAAEPDAFDRRRPGRSNGSGAAEPGARNADPRSGDPRRSDTRGADSRGVEGRGADGRGVDGRGADTRAADGGGAGTTTEVPAAPARPWARRGGRVPEPVAPPQPRYEPEPRYRDADIVEGPVRGSRHPRQKVRVVRGVRSRRLVRRVDVWTVLKVSFVFYLLILMALVIAGVIVWNVASAFGFIHSIEKSIRTLFSLKTFVLHPAATLEYGIAIGALLCLVGVLVNVLAAVAYNLISDLVGGVQVVVVTEPD